MSVLTTNYLTPTGREEAWRFTPLKRLRGLHDGTSVQSDRSTLVAKDALPKGVTFTRENLEPLAASDDVIIERIRSFSPSVAHLSIAANTELSEPIFLGRAAGALDTAEFSRVRISLGTHAVATVIVENTTDTILAEDLEIALAPGSNLKFVTLQEFESKSVYTARHHAVVDKDATFKSVTVTVGGDVVRILPTVEFKAPGAARRMHHAFCAAAARALKRSVHRHSPQRHTRCRRFRMCCCIQPYRHFFPFAGGSPKALVGHVVDGLRFAKHDFACRYVDDPNLPTRRDRLALGCNHNREFPIVKHAALSHGHVQEGAHDGAFTFDAVDAVWHDGSFVYITNRRGDSEIMGFSIVLRRVHGQSPGAAVVTRCRPHSGHEKTRPKPGGEVERSGFRNRSRRRRSW